MTMNIIKSIVFPEGNTLILREQQLIINEEITLDYLEMSYLQKMADNNIFAGHYASFVVEYFHLQDKEEAIKAFDNRAERINIAFVECDNTVIEQVKRRYYIITEIHSKSTFSHHHINAILEKERSLRISQNAIVVTEKKPLPIKTMVNVPETSKIGGNWIIGWSTPEQVKEENRKEPTIIQLINPVTGRHFELNMTEANNKLL